MPRVLRGVRLLPRYETVGRRLHGSSCLSGCGTFTLHQDDGTLSHTKRFSFLSKSLDRRRQIPCGSWRSVGSIATRSSSEFSVEISDPPAPGLGSEPKRYGRRRTLLRLWETSLRESHARPTALRTIHAEPPRSLSEGAFVYGPRVEFVLRELIGTRRTGSAAP